jgi:hypothetical protein
LTKQVTRNGEHVAHIDVEKSSSPSPALGLISTPGPSVADFELEGPFVYHDDSDLQISPSAHSPAFHRKLRTSGESLVDSAWEIFNDDFDSLGERQRKRPKISWTDHVRWKLTDRVPSPDKPENDAFALGNAELVDLTVEEPEAPSTPMHQLESTQSTTFTPEDDTPSRFRRHRDPIPAISLVKSTSKLTVFDDRYGLGGMSMFSKPSSTRPTRDNIPLEKAQETINDLPSQDIPGSSIVSTNSKSQASLVMGPPLLMPQNPQTPQLQPLTPSALPMPSPFPQDALPAPDSLNTGYFPATSTSGTRSLPTQPVVPDSTFGFSFGFSQDQTPAHSYKRALDLNTSPVDPTRQSQYQNQNHGEIISLNEPDILAIDGEPRTRTRPDDLPLDLTQPTSGAYSYYDGGARGKAFPENIDDSYDTSYSERIPSQSRHPDTRSQEPFIIDLTQPDTEISQFIPDSYNIGTPYFRDSVSLESQLPQSNLISESPILREFELSQDLNDILERPYPSQIPDTLQSSIEPDFTLPQLQQNVDPQDWRRVTPSPLLGEDDIPDNTQHSKSLSTAIEEAIDLRDVVESSILRSYDVTSQRSTEGQTQSLPVVQGLDATLEIPSNIPYQVQESQELLPSSKIAQAKTSRRSLSPSNKRVTRRAALTAERDAAMLHRKDIIPDSQESILSKPDEILGEVTQRNGSTSKASEVLGSPPSTHLSKERSTATQDSQTSSQVLSMIDQAKSVSIHGLRTPVTYYTPLSHLVRHMNRSSQFDSRVSVIAIVSRDTSKPERADKGARDYFTKFRVTQPDFWSITTLVTVFRPFKNSLPVLKKGDVVLLSFFDVIGLKGGTNGLKSGEGSGWCFWRVPSMLTGGRAAKDVVKPIWAQKAGEKAGKGNVEEIMGPPVEFGDEEREEAERLANWWDSVDGARL